MWQKNKKPKRSQKGFTLIEVLMAIVVLSVGFLALAAMTVTVIKGNARANKVTIATTLVQEKIEEIRDMSFSEIIDDEEGYGSLDRYAWARRETIVRDGTPEPNMKTIEVVVTAKDAKGSDQILVSFEVLKSE